MIRHLLGGRGAGLAALLWLSLLMVGGQNVSARPAAPTFTVNSVFDVPAGGDLSNGVCETAPANNVCTLRAAVMKANHFAGGGATINIPSGTYVLTIGPSPGDDEMTGDLNITNTVKLVGDGAAGTIVDGNATDRVLTVDTSGSVTIIGVTLRNGSNGGGAGGILVSSGALTLNNSTISGNSGFVAGGLFSNSGTTITLNSDLISGNISGNIGGGIVSTSANPMTLNNTVVSKNISGGAGGGIETTGPFVLNHSVVAGNSAGTRGGGIDAINTMLMVTNSTVNGNSARTAGGGLRVFGGSVTINNSTISANSAGITGGGINDESGALTINNSTISANNAHTDGGGIFEEGTGAIVRLFHVTVAGNLADRYATGDGTGGGIYRYIDSNPNEIWNTLMVENYAGGAPNDCGGSATTSDDYNYIQTLTGCTINGTTTHNISGGDALLDALQNNGGATPTRGLLPGSPALDQIPAGSCRDSLAVAPNPDQRGVTRPVNGLCDIGAFEGSTGALLYGRNLIRNGDAENGGGSPTGAFVGTPNWTVAFGAFTSVPYNAPGGFPSVPTDTVPLKHGYNFFAGGNAGSSLARQTVTLTAISTAIDAGQVHYDLSGDFGGYADQDDNASLAVVFYDGAQNSLGGLAIGGVNGTDRLLLTGFQHRSGPGSVPAGTRTILVGASMTRSGPSGYNDGYADNLSLVLGLNGGTLYLPLVVR